MSNKYLGEVQQYLSGAVTHTYELTYSATSFCIINDGVSALTFTINGLTITVNDGESFDEKFDLFNEIIITTTVAYRAIVRA